MTESLRFYVGQRYRHLFRVVREANSIHNRRKFGTYYVRSSPWLDKLWVRSIGAFIRFYTSTFGPRGNSGIEDRLELLVFCLSIRSDRFYVLIQTRSAAFLVWGGQIPPWWRICQHGEYRRLCQSIILPVAQTSRRTTAFHALSYMRTGCELAIRMAGLPPRHIMCNAAIHRKHGMQG